jgi:hypothetical protein
VWQIISIPVRIFFQGKDDDPKYFDGKLNPFLLLLPLLSFIGLGQDTRVIKREKLFLAVFSILYLLIVFFKTDMRIRYVSPIIPPLVILSIYGLFNFIKLGDRQKNHHRQRFLKATAFLAMGLMFFLNVSYLVEQYRIVDPLPYIKGEIGRDAYITRYRPEYPVFQYANKHLPTDTKILGIFLGKRSYYCEKNIIFDFSFIKKSVKESDDFRRLKAELSKRGVTHLIVRFDLFNKWANDSFNEKEKKILSDFFNLRTRTIYSEKGYGLMELREGR